MRRAPMHAPVDSAQGPSEIVVASTASKNGQQTELEWELQSGAMVRLASRDRGAELLGQADTYSAQLSPFDLTAKLQREQPGTEKEYLAHAAGQVRSFLPDEIEAMARNVALVRAALERIEVHLPLPPVVEVVRSSLLEEGGMAGYTRRHVIVLGPRALDVRTFAHELFHVVSRNSPETRAQLYELLGVLIVPPMTLPSPLDERVVTNPDAPLLDTVLSGQERGRSLHLTMVLVAPSPYRGGPLGPYVKPRLLEVRRHGETWSCEQRDDGPVLFDRSEVQGLKEKLGTNTSYDIHPEEVSAEHFVLMLAGKGDIPRPDLVAGMYDVFSAIPRPSTGA